MKIFTLTNKGNLFAGATLPLGRTKEGQYYLKIPQGQGPEVAIDLLLSLQTKVIAPVDLSRGGEIILTQASIAQRADGHYQLTRHPSESQKDQAVLVWIPDLKEEIEVNQGKVIGGVSKILENSHGGIQRVGAGGLVRMEPYGSFTLATYHNISAQDTEPRQDCSAGIKMICQSLSQMARRQLSAVEVRYDGNGHFSVAGQHVPDYILKWS